MQVTGLFTLGFAQFGPQPRIDQNYEGVDNFSVVHGHHSLKFGADVRKWLVWNPFETYNSGFYTFSPTGTYSTGNAGADFLLGIPAFYAQSSGGLQHNRAYQVLQLRPGRIQAASEPDADLRSRLDDRHADDQLRFSRPRPGSV